MSADGIRQRRIGLPRAATSEQLEALRRRCGDMDGIEGYEFGEGALDIRYHFPQVSLGMILRLVRAHAGTHPVDRGMSFAAWLEDNERDHLLSRDGWEHYLQDVYVSHYRRHQPQRKAQQRKEWQQYRRELDPVTAEDDSTQKPV